MGGEGRDVSWIIWIAVKEPETPHVSCIHILQGLCELSPRQHRFFEHLLSLWPCLNGRFTLLNLSRYSCFCERTFRRHLAYPFPWLAFNAALLASIHTDSGEAMLALDASFVPKSGRATQGVARFYNGCSQRVERGLELSLVAVVDLSRNTAYALHAQQTLPASGQPCKDLTHLQATQAYWPQGVRHLAVDGAYARHAFVEGVCDLGLEVVSRLRADANLRYLFTGEQSGRGRPKLYDRKVKWNELDLQRWHEDGELEKGVHLYSATLNHKSLKRTIRVALLLTTTRQGKERRVLLFSTDLKLSGREVVRLYRARFQIEFLFREAKSHAGLTHCQSRSQQTLHNHWNAAFAVVNLAKLTTSQRVSAPFSFSSCVQKQRNVHFLQVVSGTLGLDWNTIKAHPRFQSLQNYAVIAP
ncbi:hypothetical protein IAD21_05626 [Abditibacteriota bacterium]|nr:hypothetical protein IAD21_05626 [Abditibacteriota bacterium]